MSRRHSAAAMVQRDLRAAEDVLAALGLAERFDASELHDLIQARRQRRIHLIPRPLPADAMHGVWVAATGADYVFYPEDASPIRRNAIIGHEYGHILFDDAATPAKGEHIVAMLLPNLDPTVPAMLLARTTYDEAIERRAEIFGTVVAQRVASWAALANESTADPEVLARMTSTLEAGAS